MNDRFDIIASIIKNRRSTKPVKMNGKKIPDEHVRELLKLANWAPTHGRTEPWRFIVYSGDKVREFCHQHAELYKAHIPKEKFEWIEEWHADINRNYLIGVLPFSELKNSKWWKEDNVSLILGPEPIIEDVEIRKLKKKSLELAGITL